MEVVYGGEGEEDSPEKSETAASQLHSREKVKRGMRI